MLKLLSKFKEVVVLAIIIFGLLGYLRFSTWQYRQDFAEMTEVEVHAHLGDPYFDDRLTGEGNKDSFTLGWKFGLEQALFIVFKDGKAVSQDIYSR